MLCHLTREYCYCSCYVGNLRYTYFIYRCQTTEEFVIFISLQSFAIIILSLLRILMARHRGLFFLQGSYDNYYFIVKRILQLLLLVRRNNIMLTAR